MFPTISQGNSLHNPTLTCLSTSTSNLTPTLTQTTTNLRACVCAHTHPPTHFRLNNVNLATISQIPNCGTHGSPIVLSTQLTPPGPSNPSSDFTTSRKPLLSTSCRLSYSPFLSAPSALYLLHLYVIIALCLNSLHISPTRLDRGQVLPFNSGTPVLSGFLEE